MVKIALQITAALERVEELKPSGPEFRWYLTFTCNNCGEGTKKWNYVSLNESTPAQRGNAVNHFVNKCKLCGRENSMTIVEDSIKPYTADNEGKFQTIAVFDCRGLEPNDFWAKDGWVVKTADNGTTFADVDLSEGTWADYCEKIKEPVEITDVKHRFERVK